MLRYVACIILVISSIEVGRHSGDSIAPLLLMGLIVSILTAWAVPIIRPYLVVGVVASTLVIRANQTLPPSYFVPGIYHNQQLEIYATVVEEPQDSQSSIQVVLGDIKLAEKSPRTWPGKLIMTTSKYAPLKYGDRVKVQGKFQDLRSIKDEGYRYYLYYHQIYGRIAWPKATALHENRGNKLIALGINIQHAVNQKINRLLPQDAAAFLSGVVLGARLPVSNDFADSLKATGTNHLIVASGYNISILISLMIKIGRHLSKNTAILLVITMVACYTLISGLDPSIVRAATMASLGLIAVAFGRQREAVYLMIVSGVGMLLINPLWIYDVGFQLSFAATFGIITMQSFISSKLVRLPKLLCEAVSTTLAAQVFVYPILAVSFGQISIISLLTNMLVVWVVPVIMFSGIMVILLSFILEPVSHLCAVLIYPLIQYVKSVITVTAHTPYAVINVPQASWVIVSAYYALIYYLYLIGRLHETDSAS